MKPKHTHSTFALKKHKVVSKAYRVSKAELTFACIFLYECKLERVRMEVNPMHGFKLASVSKISPSRIMLNEMLENIHKGIRQHF